MIIGMSQSMGHIGTEIRLLSDYNIGLPSHVNLTRTLLNMDIVDTLTTQFRDNT